MPKHKVNFAEVQRGGKVVETGYYYAKCIDAEPKVLGGKDVDELTWLIIQGPQEGTKIRDRIFWTEAAHWRVQDLMIAVGQDPGDQTLELEGSDFIGYECWIGVTKDPMDKYPDRYVNNISSFHAVNPDTSKINDDDSDDDEDDD